MIKTGGTSAALIPLKVTAAAKHDWQAIRHDYVVMGATRSQVIQKYEVSARLFDYHAKKGEWNALKEELEGRLRQLTIGIPEVPESVLEAVDQQWRQRFRELEQMAVYMQRWIAIQIKNGAIEPAQIRRLTAAQRDIIQMQRLLMGESTEILQSVDRGVEAVLVVVEKFVPDSDKERFKDAIARLIGQPAGSPAAASAAFAG